LFDEKILAEWLLKQTKGEADEADSRSEK